MKRFKIIILDDATADFREAFEYYKDISPALAKKFFACTNAALNDLKKNPFYQIRYDDFRMKIVKKFPYIIHYIIDENTKIVAVYGIRNSYQDPEKYPSV